MVKIYVKYWYNEVIDFVFANKFFSLEQILSSSMKWKELSMYLPTPSLWHNLTIISNIYLLFVT